MHNNIDYSSDHFKLLESVEEQKKIFLKTVWNVSLEISPFCNRKCSYCPISTVGRKENASYMDDAIFSRVLNDLRSIEYQERICLNIYNEPLYDMDYLIKRMREIREKLPKSHIYFSSNGDYLDKDRLDDLSKNGLNSLYVTLHVPLMEHMDHMQIANRFTEFFEKIKIPLRFSAFSPGLYVESTFQYRDIFVTVFTLNYYKRGTNRGGVVESIPYEGNRYSPCDRPFVDFVVSHDGSVFPCCQFFSDSSDHHKYLVGNVLDYNNIFEIYCHEKMVQWRRDIFPYRKKRPPCSTCSENDRIWEKEEIRDRNRQARLLISNKGYTAGRNLRKALQLVKWKV